MKKSIAYIFLLFMMLFSVDTLDAQEYNAAQDSITVDNYKYVYPGAAGAWREEFSYEGVPFLAAGLLMWNQKDEWYNVRSTVMPTFHTSFDDYIQYTPLGLTALLKACGVETRSNWWRFLASSAFSAVTTTAVVNSIKYTVKEMRPDGSRRNSFPSGHTSTAFMAATIMHKELGARSPWYSVGAYTVATATGIMRVLNNRHWINDIVFGAGVGITSVNIGYFLSDIIFKEYGINGKYTGFNSRADLSGKPSFLSIGMNVGGATNLSSPNLIGNMDAAPLNLKLKTGLTTAITAEGAYYFNRYVGLGVQLRATVASLTADYNSDYTSYIFNGADEKIAYRLKQINPSSFGTIDANIGPYASLPLGSRVRIDCKAMVGYRLVGKYDFTAEYSLAPAEKQSLLQNHINNHITAEEYESLSADIVNDSFICTDNAHSMNFNTGAGVTFAVLRNTVARAYFDYTYSAPNIRYTFNSNGTLDENRAFIPSAGAYSVVQKTPMHNFTFGFSICKTFGQ